MKFNIPKDWLLSRAHLEEGLEIGAGVPEGLLQTAPISTGSEDDLVTIEQRLSFGHFVALMRRKKGWTIEQLAERADVDMGELLVIEKDARHEPELSTVHGLAKTLEVPARRLIKMAGLTEDRSPRLAEAALRFAASADPASPLNEDEEIALQTYLRVVLEESDKK